MRPICGYRLSDEKTQHLGPFFEQFRSDALRMLSRHYSIAVADETARRIDLHRAKLERQDPEANPLRDATGVIRELATSSGGDLDLDCRVVVHFVNGQILLRLANGIKPYRHVLEAQPGISPFHLTREPEPVTAEWSERAAIWSSAFPTPRLGMGLTFQLLDGTLPTPRWTTVKRSLPSFDVRVRRTTRAWLWNASAFKSGEDYAGFRSWLATPKGKASHQDAARMIERLLVDDLEKEQLTVYGNPPDSRKAKPRPFNTAVSSNPGLIDHADVLESSDGRVFIAIMDANLSPEDRLFLQVTEQTISFVQGAKDYGQVSGVPNAAIDMLRATREVTVVEIRTIGGRKEMKAKHVAIIRDASPTGELETALSRWRSSAKPSTSKKQWAER